MPFIQLEIAICALKGINWETGINKYTLPDYSEGMRWSVTTFWTLAAPEFFSLRVFTIRLLPFRAYG